MIIFVAAAALIAGGQQGKGREHILYGKKTHSIVPATAPIAGGQQGKGREHIMYGKRTILLYLPRLPSLVDNDFSDCDEDGLRRLNYLRE
jgi:hypothetical protein